MTAIKRAQQLSAAAIEVLESGNTERARELYRESIEMTKVAIQDMGKVPTPVYDFEPLEVAS